MPWRCSFSYPSLEQTHRLPHVPEICYDQDPTAIASPAQSTTARRGVHSKEIYDDGPPR